MQTAVLAPLLLLWCLPAGHAQGPMMEIEFEPIGPEGPGVVSIEDTGDRGGMPGPPPQMLMDLMSGGMAGPMRGPLGPGGPRNHATREGELDRAIEDMLGKMVGGPAPHVNRGDGSQSGPAGQQTRRWRNADGSEEILLQGPMPGPQRSSVPVDVFRDLFPGPLVVEGPGSGPGMPFGGPDPMVLDMLQDMDRNFQDGLLPLVHGANVGGARAPRSCQHDLQRHCSRARSQVHCLGQHKEDISEPCRKDVGKSVPFLCTKFIDQFCDVLQKGILSCLGDHLKELDSQCSDAVIATQHVISKANTQKTTVKVSNPVTGEQKVHTAEGGVSLVAAPATATQREAQLDAQFKGRAGGTAPKAQANQKSATNSNKGANVLDSAAALVAEAKQIAANRLESRYKANAGDDDKSRIRKQATLPATPGLATWRSFWMALLLAAFAFTAAMLVWPDASRRFYSVFKPYMPVDEDMKPLKGLSGLELPKPPI